VDERDVDGIMRALLDIRWDVRRVLQLLEDDNGQEGEEEEDL
jgi:hypothetical protein